LAPNWIPTRAGYEPSRMSRPLSSVVNCRRLRRLESFESDLTESVIIAGMTTDEGTDGPRELVARCDCGFVARGNADDMVAAMQKHASAVHNMEAPREAILSRSRPA